MRSVIDGEIVADERPILEVSRQVDARIAWMDDDVTWLSP
jgi:hypothetical protein